MTIQTTLLSLPPELRERIYEYIALSHATRRVRRISSRSGTAPEFQITTSPLTATCSIIHKGYEAVAQKCITTLEFTATNFDFTPIMEYFRQSVNSRYLATLQSNKATLLINIAITNNNYHRDITDFYPWALFLINIQLEAKYQSDTQTWMEIHMSRPPTEFETQCVVDSETPRDVRENIEEVRRLAGDFDGEVWRAYPNFFKEMQRRYRAQWERRNCEGSWEAGV